MSPPNADTILTWKPVVPSAFDYYPFGQYMPGRYLTDTSCHCITTTRSYPGSGGGINEVSLVCSGIDNYRYGHNGQMKDNEVGGLGNHLDFKFRGYDARTGRFSSVDPLYRNYPWYSSYQFAGNTPIQAKDLEGLEPAGFSTMGLTTLLLFSSKASDVPPSNYLDNEGHPIDRRAIFWKSSQLEYAEHPFAAGLNDFGYNIAKFTGLQQVDEISNELRTGNITPSQAILESAGIIISSAGLEEGEVGFGGGDRVKGPQPNFGEAPPHGGKEHNQAIDAHVKDLRNSGAENIRKNQVQVNHNGEKVGNNRPDVQYDRDGKHHNVEYDKSAKRSQKHGETNKKNDPNANVELNILPKK